jgi:hypothetical protein
MHLSMSEQTAIVDSGPTHKLFELGMRIDDFDHHIDVCVDRRVLIEDNKF